MRDVPIPVNLITDFGLKDPYVGLMKSIIRNQSPYPPINDLTHQVPPQDETAAAFLLEYVIRDLPSPSVLTIVVDPGVGSDRDIVVLKTTGDHYVIAPDTGIVEGLEWNQAYHLTNRDIARDPISNTFHGRDWFAPASSYFSRGGELDNVGPELQRAPSGSPIPEPSINSNVVKGEIIYVDHFGNLITNIPENYVDESDRIEAGDLSPADLHSNYADADELCGVIGSFDRLELAMPGGSALKQTQLNTGDRVVIHRS